MGDGHSFIDKRDTMSYTFTQAPTDPYAGYEVSLEATDKDQCSNFYNINVNPSRPVAGFSIDSNFTCTSVLYAYTPTDIGIAPFTYAWDLGDGSTSKARTPVHSYSHNGYYRVKLQMTDAIGCIDTTSTIVHSYFIKSKANFTSDTSVGNCPPFPVHFTDKSTFAFVSNKFFDWDFGDGSPHSSIESPNKVYYLPGNYTVSLKITDSLGCTDSIIKTNIIAIKGPVGTFTISPLQGCTPLIVHFAAFSKNASRFLWDPGAGSTVPGDTLTYIYSTPGTYIPALILSDSFGCTYGLPTTDTITVNPLPIPDFTYDSVCSGLPTYFYDVTNPVKGFAANWEWNFGDSGTSTRQNPFHIYKRNGYYNVNLTAITNLGCTATMHRQIKIGGVTADFIAPDTSCVGTVIHFTDASTGDTTIKSWTWLFGDGNTSTLQNPSHAYLKKGKYTLSLFLENVKDCVDTLIKPQYLVVGDTIPPPPPDLYRVTVLSDTSVEVDFSKFQDVDYFDYILYMNDINGNLVPIRKIRRINDTIIVINKLNTLKNVYCFAVQSGNVCGHFSHLSPSHCTINITAKPGIDQALLSWTPYIGWNVLKYKIYRKSYNSQAYILLDSVQGNSLNYADTSVICYRTVTYKIQAIENGGFNQISWSDTSTTLPVHVPKLPAPELIHVTVPDNLNTLIEWKDKPAISVKKWVVEKSSDGLKYNILDTPFNRNILSVTDNRVDVQNNSYYYRVNLMDSCGDIGPYSAIGKSILLRTDTTPDVKPILRWTAYKAWPEGVRYYDIELKDINGNYNPIARAAPGNDTSYIDNSTDLNSLSQYCYRVIAHRNGPPSDPALNMNITSISNESCLKTKSRIYVPNAFTPNGDGLNDFLVVEGLFIKTFHIRIYDRWGTKVFESYSLDDTWDGTCKSCNGIYKDRKPVTDVYKYMIDATGTDGNQYYLDGNVTVLL